MKANPEIVVNVNMSLRDYFAAKAMQAMAVEYDMRPDIYDVVICEKAYKIADAMIEARLK